ncbi:MAG: hypothetical protein ACRD0S_00405 [Acidimicrobiales bacterium]
MRRARLVRALARRLRPENGTMLVIASAAMVATLAATALAVDIGRGVAVKRDLQADADIAALDSVRALGNRKGEGGLSPQALAERLAEESLDRNGFDTGGEGNSWSVELGVVDPVTRVFTLADQSLASAVQVTLTTPISWAFQPGGRTYTARGIARAGTPNEQCQGVCDDDDDDDDPDPGDDDDECEGACDAAGIAAGSFLARVDTSGGMLKSLFGRFLNGNVTLVGYQGIASGSVSLGQLRAELGFGTIDELLTTKVTARNFLAAMVNVLHNKGDAPSVQAATDLANLALAADSNLDLRLADLVKVVQGAEGAAASAEINALQLAMMVAEVANGQHAVDIALTTQNLAGPLGSLLSPLGGNTLTLKVIEAPQIAFGPPGRDSHGDWQTQVRTAQIRAQVHLRPLGTLAGGLVDVPIYLESASATAALRSITCRDPLDTSTVVVDSHAEAVKVAVGEVTNINASGSVKVKDATILDLLLTDVKGGGEVSLAGSDGRLSFDGPFDWSNTQTIGSTTLDVGRLLEARPITLSVLGAPLGGVAGSVLGLLNPILDAIDQGLIDNLLASLGVSIGGADVTAWALDCTSAPVLVG